MTDDICWLSVSQIARRYRQRKLSPREAVDAFIARIERFNRELNAFVFTTFDAAREAAQRAEADFMRGDTLPPLHGIPFSVKDNIPTGGVRSTLGSLLFKDYVPAEDAAVVANVKRAGGILLGKTNTPAFGWMGVTYNKIFGWTPNPWNPAYIAGGSSGGAAVAAATGLAPINIGTDGGGSLRTPAAFTGTVGYKPSFGRVPNYPGGNNWSVQHLGPVARSVEDIAIVLNACAQPDARDLHTLPPSGEDFAATLGAAPKKLRVVYAEQLGFVDAIDPEVSRLCRDAANAFRDLGWDVEERELDWPDPGKIHGAIVSAGNAYLLNKFMDRRDEIEDGLVAIVEQMAVAPNDAYLRAHLDRNAWVQHPRKLFETCDLLITPTTACPPFEVGKFAPDLIDGKPLPPSGWSPYLRPFNLTGQPAISVPAGRTANGLPVGLQIVGPRFGDALLLAAAAAYERLRPWPTQWAPPQTAARPRAAMAQPS